MRRGYLRIIFILIIIFSLFLTGCWNSREIDELAFVMGIALDKAQNGNIKVTVQIAKPSTFSKSPAGGAKDEKTYTLISSEGKTFFEAIRNMHTFTSRRVFWAHNKIILIGEKLARSDISEILDFFCRNPELRLRTWVVVTPGEAGKVLDKAPSMEKDPATGIENLVNQRVWTGKGYASMLKDFLQDYLGRATFPVAGRLSEDASQHLALTGAAVFNKDSMAGWLNEKETRGLLWLKDELRSTIMVVPCPSDGKPLSIEITGAKVSYKTGLDDEQPIIDVNVKATGNLTEQSCSTDFTKMDNLHSLEEALSAAVKDDIEAVTKTSQGRIGLDFPGFNRPFHMHHKKEWNSMKSQWPKLFKGMEISINVKANIPREALFARPLTSKK